MFRNEFVNGIFDNFLISLCEIFVYFFVNVGAPNDHGTAFVAGLMTMSSRVLRFWWAVHSSLERFENLRLLLKLRFSMSTRHLSTKRSTEVNWPSAVVSIRWLERFEFVSLKFIGRFFFVMKMNFKFDTANCSRKVCNTCPFINSNTHIQGPKGSYQVNDHFDCTTSNIIYCITCTLCNKLYIGESGRQLDERFREHLLDVKNKGSDLSKPVARHFNRPGHSHEHMEVCGINLHFGNNETL